MLLLLLFPFLQVAMWHVFHTPFPVQAFVAVFPVAAAATTATAVAFSVATAGVSHSPTSRALAAPVIEIAKERISINPLVAVTVHPQCRSFPWERLLPLRMQTALRRCRRRGRDPRRDRVWLAGGHFDKGQRAARVRMTEAAMERSPTVVCPPTPWRLDVGTEAHKYCTHYMERAAAGSCNSAEGMWVNASAAAPATVCKLQNLVRLFGIRPGDRVLDLGAGCGHQLHLLARMGVVGVGVELIDENIEWARLQLGRDLEAFCAGDIASPGGLPFLPNNSFNFVISNGVLRELPIGSQCAAARLSLRVLAPGGCAWLGFLRDSATLDGGRFLFQRNVRDFWRRPGCLYRRGAAAPRDVVVALVSERRFFGAVEYPSHLGFGAYSVLMCKRALQ
eukprot:TRINITY_DN69152_c0_g1_i1.p1 TRINITY_DN69152_c0_g1~~TRINITY_DN69152_c0_g1_i1.p1  ORF type:complete len:392 (+),score=56.28 TRINITY_DN69152_c0_g1_i1:135-1310(+)